MTSPAAQIEPARKAFKQQNDEKRPKAVAATDADGGGGGDHLEPPKVFVPESGPGSITLNEFCRLFRISRGMAYKLHRKGKLRFGKVGARSVVTFDEARRFERSLESDAA